MVGLILLVSAIFAITIMNAQCQIEEEKRRKLIRQNKIEKDEYNRRKLEREFNSYKASK